MKRRFETTRWSRVLAARQGDPDGRAALAALCEDYWQPLYFFCRRRGYSAEDAQDLTQSYLVQFLEKRYVERVSPEAGRLRTFLLVSFKNFLANDYDKTVALKRGGGIETVSLEIEAAEKAWTREPVDGHTPEDVFERRWAVGMLERTFARLQHDAQRRGQVGLYDALMSDLSGDASLDYERTAAELNMSEGAVRTALYRMRRRFGELLRQEIAETVLPADVEDELRHLVARLRA